MERERSQYERTRHAVAPVVSPTAGVPARAAWAPEHDVGLLCPGCGAGWKHTPAAGLGDVGRPECGQDAQHRTASGALSGQWPHRRGPGLDTSAGPAPALLA